MDTEVATHTNWWWGEVNADVARLYIQATDNISGIARVACPTSTQSGGYNNWVWFETVWDSGANAYRADITPATFGHYGQTYATHLYIWDNAGNGGYYNATNVNIPSKILYGTSIQSSYSTLYTTNYPNGYTGVSGMDQYYYGNYNKSHALVHERIEKCINISQSNTGHAWIYSGTKDYNFTTSVLNSWVAITFGDGYLTTGVTLADFALRFKDGSYLTVEDSVTQGYIEPLAICASGSTNSWCRIQKYIKYTKWRFY